MVALLWQYTVSLGRQARHQLRWVGPLFFLDLARLARRWRTPLVRCLYPCAILLWLCVRVRDQFHLSWLAYFQRAPAMPIADWAVFGQSLGMDLLTMQAAAVLVLTPAYLAGAVAEEKERRILDVVFTTDLLDREIVLGKLCGRLMHLITVLMAALPVFAFVRLWGGIDDNVLWAGFLIAFLTLLSAGSVSVLCSVLFRSVLAALIVSYGVTFLMNATCLLLPVVSPVYLLPTWEKEVEAAWAEWESATPYVTGLSQRDFLLLYPPPNATWILLRLLAPFVLAHGLIAVAAVIAAIRLVRERCLEPGETVCQGVPVENDAHFVRRLYNRRRRGAESLPLAVRHWAHPVREPALLWKEIYHGIPAAPGPGMGGWQLPNRRQVLITLGCLAVLSWFLLCVRPTLWQILAGGLNQILRFVSVLFVGVWCWLLAFRAASCVSLERERRTLDGLLALPVDRAEILKAKWLGNVLRFRELAYLLLLMILVPGIAVGALHPAGVLLFMLAAGVHLAFFASLGLWLSLASRNTLWANMATAVILLLLFGGLRVGSAFTEISFRAAEGDWFLQVLHLAISPGRVWWFSLLSWTEFAAGEERWLGTLGQSLASLCLFAATAWLLWRLSCRQFRVQ